MTNGKFCLLFLRLCSAAPIFAPSPMRSFAAGWGSRPQQVRRLNGQLLRLLFQSRRLDFQSQEVGVKGATHAYILYVFYSLEKCFNPSASIYSSLGISAKLAEGFDFQTLQQGSAWRC